MTTKTVERGGARATAARAPARKQTAASARGPAQKQTAATATRSARQAGAPAADHTGPRRPVAHAVVAAERAVRRNGLNIQLPVVGELRLPAAEEVAFIGGVAALAVVGFLEWPVAVLLGVGHGLALSRRNKVLRAFGEALEEA